MPPKWPPPKLPPMPPTWPPAKPPPWPPPPPKPPPCPPPPPPPLARTRTSGLLTVFRGCVCWELPKLPGCATAPTAESASANAPKRPDVIGLCFSIALHSHVFCAKAAHLNTHSHRRGWYALER